MAEPLPIATAGEATSSFTRDLFAGRSLKVSLRHALGLAQAACLDRPCTAAMSTAAPISMRSLTQNSVSPIRWARNSWASRMRRSCSTVSSHRCFWISVTRTLTETELARCTFAGAAEAADDHADNGGPAVAPAPQSRRSLARARARAEGTGGHKLRVPEAQDTDNTATETEPAPAASTASEPDTSSMTNKERKAYFKAVRVTALDQPRAEKPPKKRAKAD